jgi:hypothetical protein
LKKNQSIYKELISQISLYKFLRKKRRLKTMISEIGLFLIIVGWIIQFVYLSKKNDISMYFVIVYGAGVALLVIDGFMSRLLSLAWLNLISLLAIVMVMFRIKQKEAPK